MKTKMLVLALMISGCGGGGGSDGEQSDASVCRGYCDYSCAKAGNCFGLAASDVSECGDGCFAKIDASGSDGETCRNATEAIGAMSCQELANFLGLSRRVDRTTGDIGEPLSNVERLVFGE